MVRKEVVLSNSNYLELKRLVKELETLWSWKEFYEKRSRFVCNVWNSSKGRHQKKTYIQPRFVDLMNKTQAKVELKQKELNDFKKSIKAQKRNKR